MSEDKSDFSRRPTISMPVRLSVELADQLAAAASEIGLSKQDMIRLSLERGLPVLKDQLTAHKEPA